MDRRKQLSNEQTPPRYGDRPPQLPPDIGGNPMPFEQNGTMPMQGMPPVGAGIPNTPPNGMTSAPAMGAGTDPVLETIRRNYAAQKGAGDAQSGSDGMGIQESAMTHERLMKGIETLKKYKAGKANLDRRIRDAEDWWRLQNYAHNRMGNPLEHRSTTGWLFSTILSKHADVMNGIPEANILPRERSDEEEARALSDIIPVILKQNDFTETFSEVMWQKLKFGTGVYGVFWDPKKLHGLGDVVVKRINALNLFWEPGVEHIQDSQNVFLVQLADKEVVKQMYPDVKFTTGEQISVQRFNTEDNIDTTEKCELVDWYYHINRNGKQELHYCKFTSDKVLVCSEDDPAYDGGWYHHGQYPFVLDVLFPVEGSPSGFGYVDVCRSPQETIDTLTSAAVKNAIMCATPRWMVRTDTPFNLEEYLDWRTPYITVPGGSLSEESLRQVQVNPMPATSYNILQHSIEEMKETSGNRDTANGGNVPGVTAASAIASMQEQAGKLSKDSTRTTYRAYENVIRLVIELIRQFYDVQRQFRITGEMGQTQYIDYSNIGIKPQMMEAIFSQGSGYRVPEFDIDVVAQNATEYTKMSQNEFALQLYNQGILNPQNTDMALAVLKLMDFDGKYELMQQVSENGTMQQMLAQYQSLALQLAQRYDPAMAEGLAQAITQNAAPAPIEQNGGSAADNSKIDQSRSDEFGGAQKEHAFVEKARARAQEAFNP